MEKDVKARSTKRKQKPSNGSPRSAARLAAVQALYQLEHQKDTDPRHIVTEFRTFRLGREIEGDQYVTPDQDLFSDLVLGTSERQKSIDEAIRPALNPDWPFERLEAVLRAILRAATYEFMARPDVPTAVIINEYLDVAHAFFERSEVSFANGVLDKLSKSIRT